MMNYTSARILADVLDAGSIPRQRLEHLYGTWAVRDAIGQTCLTERLRDGKPTIFAEGT